MSSVTFFLTPFPNKSAWLETDNKKLTQTMSEKLPIRYSGFWDFPLAFTVRWKERLYLFFREFDDARDDYEEEYRVSLLPPWTDEEIEASWGRQIETQAADCLGAVAVKDVSFDSTHRREIDAAIFQTLAAPRKAVGVMR